MNKRIKEIADEAAKFSSIMALPTGESGDKLFVEKFAELIVLECASRAETKLLKNLKIHQTHQMSYNEGLRAGITAFKKHFGVAKDD